MDLTKKRGLSALLQNTSAVEPDKRRESAIKLVEIRPNPAQPRREFEPEALAELTESVKSRGVLQPILVRKLGAGEIKGNEQYEIIAGERRWRAATAAGLTEIPALVRDGIDPQEVLVLSMIENLQRDDLNPIEEALAFASLRADQFKLTQEAISAAVGKSRAYVANSLRLLDLPQNIQRAVQAGNLSAGHAKILAGIKDSSVQNSLAAKCQAEGWSVRQLELFALGKESISNAQSSLAKQLKHKSAQIKNMENQFSKILGTKVEIEEGRKKGRIVIEFYSVSDFDRITSLIGVSKE